MARMTGVVPALYQNFMQTLDRKRAMQEQELERQRKNAELQSMFASLFPGSNIPPGSITGVTAPGILQTLGDREQITAQQNRIETQTQAEANKKAAEQLERDAKDKAKLDAEINAFYSAHPDFNAFTVNTRASLEYAKEETERMERTRKFKEEEDYRTQKNIDQVKALRPPERPQQPPVYTETQVREVQNTIRRLASNPSALKDYLGSPGVQLLLRDIEEKDPMLDAQIKRDIISSGMVGTGQPVSGPLIRNSSFGVGGKY